MDTFDKLYKQSKVNRASSPNSTSKWFKNATRSIGHSAFDVVSSFMPATMDTTVSMKDVQKDLRESFIDTKKVGLLKSGSLVALGKELWNNSLEDLKSGNFHNQGRIDAAEAKSMGFEDFDFGEFDFGNGDNDFNVDMSSSDGQSAVQMKRKSGKNNEVTQINIETNLGKDSAVVQATERQTEVSIKTAQQLAEVSNNNTKIMMSHISKLGKTVSGQLATINNNLSMVSTIVSESMTSHFTVANKYYEDSLEIFTEMNKTLVSMHEMLATTHKPSAPTDREVSEYNSVLDIFTAKGGLNTSAYKDLVKKQFRGYMDSTMLGQMITMGKMGSQMGMMDDLKNSPVSTMITAGMKAIVPKAVKGALADFDSQLKESLATGLFKVNGLKGSQNPLLQAIGNIFGIKNTKYTVNKGNYNKGPMAWNGIAHRTLVDVIPTYLSQIAAAVTGTEQRVFDYKEGKYATLSSIREDHNRRDREEQLSPYGEIRTAFKEFLDEFQFNSTEHKKTYNDKFDKYLLDIVKSSGNMNFNNTQQLVNSVGDETVAKMIQQFMRTSNNKSMITAAYGRNALEAIENISTRNKKIEADPTQYNHQYIDNGMTTISGRNGGVFGHKVDKYDHDDLFYLRRILQTLNTAVPVRIIKGSKNFNKRMLAEMGANSISSASVSSDAQQSTSAHTSSVSSIFGVEGIRLEDAANMTPEQLQQAIRNQHPDRQPSTSGLLKMLKSLGVKEDSNMYKLANNFTTRISNASNGATSGINKATNTLFTLLFGDGDERGVQGAINLVINGVRKQIGKFGNFIDKKVIGPLNESLFGDDGIFTKISESEKFALIKEKFNNMKTKAVDFLFGEKGEDGKRKNGIFSETLNSLSDMGTSAKQFILHDEDGIVSNMKSMFKDITGSVKVALGIEEDENAPKTSFSEKISAGASDFLSHVKQRGTEWMDLIFGANRDENGNRIKTELSEGFEIFKSDMKGKKGKLGASATIGLLSSFFLPGGPIGGALLGLGTGIISESSQLKDFLFGKMGEDGKRGNNGIISQDIQNFFKDNKTGISVGAFAGIASSIGLLPAFFVPGGPIGGALLGGAVAMAHKSGAFNDLIYGEGGTKENITGGITKFIQDHYKKDANIKSTFMDAGLGAGVGILGSFFLPGGPITGALLGSAASIVMNTDKFKTLMFGDEELDENGNKTGRRKGGLFGKFTNYIGDKVLLPLQKAAKTTQVKMLEWIETKMVNPLKVAMKPFQIAGKNFMDGVKGTVDELKESFRARVTKPLGDAVEEHILNPMKKAFSKIFGGLGKIVGSFLSAPFRMIQGAAGSLNKSQNKSGQSDYDMNAELEKLNAGTKSKFKRKMRDVRKENAKQKHWRNPLANQQRSNRLQTIVTATGEVVQGVSVTQENVDAVGNPTTVAMPESKQSSNRSNSERTEQGNGTRMRPLNLQFFASSAASGEVDIEEFIKEKLLSIDNNIKSIWGHIDPSNKTRVNASNLNGSSEAGHVSSIETYVKTISESVDGQLNGVGYNVNKILRVLLKKNGITEDEVAGENNKKYSRGGRLKRLLTAPFRAIKSGVAGIVDTAKNIIHEALSGVTTIAKGLASIPKTIVKAGIAVAKGAGNAMMTILKGAATAVSTGLTAVGNVITGAATGFGQMIGKASEGFGQLIGGALGGLGNLLHGVGLIGKELGPVIAKGIGTLIGAPFKLVGAAGGFIANLFGKKKGGSRSSGGVLSHVIVDEYMGEDRIIRALNAIEFAVLHGKPMDGEGPKYKGSQIIDVDTTDVTPTQIALPANLQFFANSAGGDNGLPNTMRATNDHEEKMELATRVAQGSASELNERFQAEDDKKEERTFRERLLAKFTQNNEEQKKQGIDWSNIFSKKGLITGALIAAVPLIIKYLPSIVNFVKDIWESVGGIFEKIGSWLGDTGARVLDNAASQGGAVGILNGVGETTRSVTDLLGTTQREEYVIGENGQILTDENGNPIKESKGEEGLGTRIAQFYTPTRTKIDHETGQAYQEMQYDGVTRGKIHATRRVAKKVYKTGEKIVNGTKTGVRTAKNAGKSIKKGIKKTGSKLSDVAQTAAIHIDDFTHTSKATAAYDAVANVAKKPGQVVDSAKGAVKKAGTKVKTATSGTVDKIIKYGKEAFDTLVTKFSDLITKYAPKAGSKISKITGFIMKGFKKVFNVKTVTKFMSRFTKVLAKIATAAATVLTSELFWGITGAIEGATNASYTFEVSDDAVDGKMRAIAAIFRALLATSIGSFVDIADSILYEITGTSFVNELAVLAYELISDDDDVEALKQARKSFDDSYNTYVEEEYEAYKKNQEANGEAAMTMDEFKASDLATSKQTYNSEQNKSWVKRAWDGVQDFGRNVKETAVKTIDGAKKGLSYIGGKISDGASWVKDKVTGGVTKIKETATNTFTGAKKGVQFIGGKIKDGAAWVGDKISDGASWVKDKATNIATSAKNFVSDKVSQAKEGIDVITTKVSDFGNSIKDKITNVKDNVGSAMSNVISSIKEDGLAGTIKNIGSAFMNKVNAAKEGKDPDSKDGEKKGGMVTGIINTITDVAANPITSIVKGVSSVGDGIKSIFGKMKDFASNIKEYANVFDGKTTTANYWEIPKEDKDSPFSGLNSVLFYIIRGAMAIPFYLSTALGSLKDKISDGIGGIVDSVKGFFGFGDDESEESGGSGGFGGNASAPRSAKTSLNGFTYYSQNDTRIKDQEYNQTDGTPGTMGERGCGPTALSMVASELTGKDYDPVSMAKLAESTGFSTDVGTTTGYFGAVGNQLGMNVSGGNANPDSIVRSLRKGNPVILQGSGGSDTPYTSKGHYVVGVGMKDGNVLVNDPRGPQYSKAYSLDKIMNGAAGMWSFSGGNGPQDETETTTTTTATNANAEAEQAVVNAMYSIKEKNQYSQDNRNHVGDTLNGAAQGSGDCSSTVRWAYQQALGIDPGSYTGAQITSSNGWRVDQSNGGAPTESNLRPGDLLFYTKSGRGTHAESDVGHVEMYVGNNTLMGHGSGIGPKERTMSTYRLDDYIGAKRYIGDGTDVVDNFNGVSSGIASGANAGISMATGTNGSTSGETSSPTSISDLISGAISAVSTGINNFFGLSSGSTDATSSGTTMTGDASTGTGATSSINVTPDQAKASIWTTFREKGLTPEGTSGLMGNLHKESGLMSNNLQNSGNKSLGLSDDEYTSKVDSGSYGNFVNDSIGYGLAQWTSAGRKQGLLNLAKSKKTSIADPAMQSEWLYQELSTGYKDVLDVLTTTNNIKVASDKVLHDFEKPADQSPAEENQRASFAASYYNALAGNNIGGHGTGPKVSRYQSRYQKPMGGFGPTTGTRQSSSQAIATSSMHMTSPQTSPRKAINPSDMMNKLFDYLGKIVTYMESTSSGIAKLNQKDFGGTNYVNQPSYTNVNGGTLSPQQSETPDTSNYDLGRLIAQGQLT